MQVTASSDDGAYAPMPKELEALAAIIVDAGMKVHKALGPGLLESVYEQCLAYELSERGRVVRRQVPVSLTYGKLRLESVYRIDIVVNDAIIVEVKAAEALTAVHQAQLLTYLKLMDRRLGLLMNFNVALFKQGIKRIAR
jgi:GxxExxY protein